MKSIAASTVPADRPLRRRTTRRRSRRLDHGRPVARIELAPLAAICLTATGLIASAYPLQTHALTVDLPAPLPGDYLGPLTPTRDVLTVDKRLALRWNGAAIDKRDLPSITMQRQARTDPGALLFRPDGDVAYADTLAILALLQRSGAIDRCFRFSQLALFGRYEQSERPPDPAPADTTRCDPVTAW